MRFIVDECAGPKLAQWLSDWGHEVYSVHDEARGMSDLAILHKAVSEAWIIITNDRDFGEMVFREHLPHRGIIFIRLSNERSANKINAIQRLLDTYSSQLSDRFVVVTETQVRFSQPPRP